MRDFIEIVKSEIPCSFDIVLGAEEFNMEIKYNKQADLFTCTLSKDGKVLVHDEPMIYGTPLFKDVYDAATFPALDIVPYDESGKSETVTFENFGTSVLLTIDDEG